eukprot:TRINITY_DN1771_c3_g1_i1.p1 TRINITY_DN1771_c3_g1~~TRINITY_DN1771_c3_g1_i1.p1  ORF type:complete len:173 (+),score=52.01 TRINITY_DN1771_c3_g1_i1:198-716(+)
MSMPGGPQGKGMSVHTVDMLKQQDMAGGEEAAYDLIKEEDLANMTELEKTRLDFRFWKQKASEYSFGQGELVTVTRTGLPRLDHYKKCHEVVKDFVRCKAVNRFVTGTGVCNPLKDQVTLCVNDSWVERYHFRRKMYQDVWTNQEQLFASTHEKAKYDRSFLSMMVDDHDAD